MGAMSLEYYIFFYSTVFTNPIVNPRSHEFEPKQSEPKPTKQNKPKPLRESNLKLVQRFSLYAVRYSLIYQEVVAVLHEMALKNPRCHLRQNRPKSYFAIDGKIDTTLYKK